MPALPVNLSNPGLLLARCLVIGLVVGVNATLLGLLRRGAGRGGGEAGLWGRALGGARERQHQQTAQLDELHRAVSALSTPPAQDDKPRE